MKINGRHVVYSFVLLLTGFVIALSYQFANERNEAPISQTEWRQEDELRNRIIVEQTVNKNLQADLRAYQTKVREIEAQITELDKQQDIRVANYMEEIERLRKLAGIVKVKGPGVEIHLSDSSYFPEGANPNDYIVHEQHIQMVIDELLIAGAEAISINGYRISEHSFIQCVGPVINIDRNTSFAPFVISAIGDPVKMEQSLNIYGGIKDQLVNDYIEVRIQQKEDIVMEPLLTEKG